MFRHISLILILLVGLVGCVSDRTTSAVLDDHPASASSSIASMPVSTSTLAIVEHVVVTPAATMQMDHSHGHGQPSTDTKAMEHGTMKGMDAEAAEPKHDHSTIPPDTSPKPPSTDAQMYVCPMHAEVTSMDSAARCPKCGMKLKTKPSAEEAK